MTNDPMTDTEFDAVPVLHIYAQYMQHEDALIIGNRAGLIALRDAIDKTLARGTAKAKAFCNDGEGFGAKIELRNGPIGSKIWNGLKMPYRCFEIWEAESK